MINASFYQSDVLFLLVGANPLPNYVSALLLTKPRATVYLLHTNATFGVTERLSEQIHIKRSDLTLIPWEISKSDPQLIEQRLESLARELNPNAHIGLNYTGGSKPMAVQAYHTLSTTYPHSVFSYLDADTLSLMIEAPGMPTQQVSVGGSVELDFDTLFTLHGYELTVQRTMVFPSALRQALVEVHSTRAGIKQWRKWIETFGQGSPQLPVKKDYPALAPAIREIETLCGNDAVTPAQLAGKLGCKNGRLESCAKLLFSGWLEEHVYGTLRLAMPELDQQQLGLGLEFERPGQRGLELDTAVILGYQLFAVSCIVTDRVQSAKDHLMETFVRARQLGGDEARFALVSCIEDADMMEREVSRSWDAEGKIRVFGREHLPDLTLHFREWITTAGQLR